MRSFKKSSNFGSRSSERSGGRSFKKFDRDKSSKFGDRSSGPKRFGDRDSSGGGFKLHKVICDKCGRECDVPFQPTGDKPIYCRSCFRENGNGTVKEFAPRKGSTGDRFSPREEKRFDRNERNAEFKEPDRSSDDLAEINEKLDKIMRALNID
jgi:CxxC-x17-CxxC domain-containing protein